MGGWISRVLKWLIVVVLPLALIVVVTGRALLAGSLAREQGSAQLAGLSAPVEVRRDARGVPAIRARGDDFADVARALGFVHAQERFFQMDLFRREAAGELAALVGPAGLGADREARRFRFRRIAAGVLEHLPPEHMRWLEAYSAGVNAGLAALKVRPPEYLALWQKPAPWKPEDSLLVMFSMYQELTQGDDFEWRYGVMNDVLPKGVADFLMPETSRFDAPLIGPPGDPKGLAPIPSVDVDVGHARTDLPLNFERPPALGSNNWAVASSRTRARRAILANDMHLGMMAPGVWYHAQLEWGGRRIAGVSLPGVPGIVAGSNGRVAWGHTNATGDFEDYVVIEPHPADARRYRFGPGDKDFEAFGEEPEEIVVRGRAPETLVVRTTRWGPVVRSDSAGRALALRWPALDPAAVNLNVLDLMTASSLEEGVRVVQGWWGPPQNVVIASNDGRIAWTLSGWLPRREGMSGKASVSWASPGVGWIGRLDESEHPSLIDPGDGVLFSANARTLPLEQARMFGWCWAPGERAGRIAELLRARSDFDERAMLRMQLDTRVAALDFYRDLILRIVPATEADANLLGARRAAASWNGRADADQVGMRIIALFQSALMRAIILPIAKPCTDKAPGFTYWSFMDDEPLMRIIEEGPRRFLPPGASDWTAVFRKALADSLVRADGSRIAADLTWGQWNAVTVRHPLSLVSSLLGRLLNMPRLELPGHPSAVRVQGRTFGASQRLVVSPGHEEDGILEIPCGQSGHPLSAHYADRHLEWAHGEPSALLAGEAVSVLTLTPPTATPAK